ncbi:cytochrome c1 [Pseudoroseomonas wenyumeiae]|uniref:Cytochrome c1 n=1 Tax=Teichococcus wenyumeiae TaxID=2478470 RepID=A0A3A9J9F6_9PROT|nr:cytochrome c1 [Pseudoroseomonas wenyumeiae]RKK03062.1 cytochrome c1 [Pseudoroseomonas wenyumeiae]RMI24798.1 cytochrome c1 [Pseudoroseomonas wenyumeiae]
MALRFVKSAALAAAMTLGLAAGAVAAEGEIHIPDTKYSFDGPFGTYDRGELQRGFQIYKDVCAACHSMNLLSYRNLQDIGLSADEVTAVAAGVQIPDGPNDNGEMFERPGRPSDRFRHPFANTAAARAANNGALPPDLSVITKARVGGADYIHALLTGYEEPPAGMTVMEGMHYNKYFPGHQIAMAPPLSQEGQVTYADGTKATVDQMARDVSAFLTWAAEPELETRRAMGVRVLIFLAILGGLAYAVKRKTWANVH